MSFPIGWTRRTKLVINSTFVDSNLVNFPILLDETNLPAEMLVDGGTFSAAPSGTDIRCSLDKSGAVELSVEVVTFDISSNTAQIWVKIPSIASGIDTEFYIWYANKDATTPSPNASEGSRNVWSNGFVGVWHLDQTASSTSGHYLDSTSNVHHGTFSGAPNTQTGQIESSIDFDLASSEALDIGNLESELGGTTTLTISVWHESDNNGVDQSIVSKGGTLTTEPFTLFRDEVGSTTGRTNIYKWAGSDGTNSFAMEGATDSANDFLFHHVVTTFSGSDTSGARLYVDGVEDANSPVSTVSVSAIASKPTSPVLFGANDNSTRFLSGNLDEVRISNVVRESGWISTEYNNQTSASNFITSEESTTIPILDGFLRRCELTIPSSAVGGVFTDFPIVLTSATIPTDVFQNAQSTGADIRFTDDGEGTSLLAREIVEFSTSGDAEIWVKIPSLTNVTDNKIYLWYDNTSATEPDTSATDGSLNVWDEDYVAVWHLNQDPGGTAPQIVDSTSFGNSGTTSAMDSSNLVDGVIGKAISFDGTTESIGIGATDNIGDIINNVTVEFIFKTDTVTGGSHRAFAAETINSGNGIAFGLSNDDLRFTTLGVTDYTAPTTNIQIGVWHHVVIILDTGNDATFILDGVDLGTDTAGSPGNTNGDDGYQIGAGLPGSFEGWDGTISDIQITRDTKTVAFAQTRFRNVTSGTNFIQTAECVIGLKELGWTNRCELTIFSSAVDEPLVDFPILLTSATLDGDIFNRCNADGSDIRFTTDSLGVNLIPFEIVSFSPSTSALEIWVKIPNVNDLSDTTFYQWCGNTGASAIPSSASNGSFEVWETNFGGVYHLGDTSAFDSTENANDGAWVGTLPNTVTGAILSAQEFNGTSDEIEIPDNPTLDFGTSDFFASGWFKIDDVSQVRQVISKRTPGGGNYEIQVSSITPELDAFIGDSGGTDMVGGVQTIVLGRTYHFMLTRVGSTVSMYIDGVLDASTTSTRNVDSTADLIIGNANVFSEHFDGVIDEIRVGDIGRTVGWASAEFRNGTSGVDFVRTIECISFGFEVSGTGALITPVTEVSGVGLNGPTGTGALTISGTSVSGVGLTGSTGTGALTMPGTEVSGVGSIPSTGTGDIIIPRVIINGIGKVTKETAEEKALEDLLSQQFLDIFAQDIAKNTIEVGYVINEKAINISLENILSTIRGERIFSPFFGSPLPLIIFEQLNVASAETLLEELLTAINFWEDRITILEEQIQLDIMTDQNMIFLSIPYIINRNGLTGTFSRNIIL